jgi:hypothetical protein
MGKKDKFEINIEEAKEIIAKCIHPDYSNEEHELFKVAAAKLLDEKDPGFKYEYEYEEEEASVEKSDESLFSRAKDYGKEIVNNVKSLGAAGIVAFSSAAYFQSVEAFKTTHEIGSVIRSVESDYGQSLMSYVGGIIMEMIESTEESNEESQSEEGDTEEGTEESNEESQSEEASSENKVEQSNPQNNEHQEKTENEESAIETNGSKTKSNVQTDVIQSETNGGGNIDAIDDIKPHSMVEDDDNSVFEPVFTSHDAIIVSPEGPLK